MSLLEVKDLTIGYPQAARPVVDRMSFTIGKGESVGLVGESGSGKSQTALGIMGLLPANARVDGTVLFDGHQLAGAGDRTLNRFRARRLAMVFQDPQQALNPYLRIGDQLKRVLLEHRVVTKAGVRQRALELLHRAGLPDPARQFGSFPHQLSGGMRQRAMLALALACAPELLIADEPTTALDVTVQAQILALLRELRARTGIGLLLITHDLGVIAENCRRMLVMDRGRLIEQGETVEVFRRPSHPLMKAMLAAAPRIETIPAREAQAAGDEQPALCIENLSVSFRQENRPWRPRETVSAVTDFSLAVQRGETVAVVGESGSGKTTVARAVLGLIPADAGRVSVFGEPLPGPVQSRSRAQLRSIQMVFQEPSASLNPAMRIGRIIAEAIELHEPRTGRSDRDARVASLLGRVGLDATLKERYPHELSGGQAQRVAIARALVPQPQVLVCDEPVAALDGKARQGVLDLLQAEQHRTGLSLLFITHDLAVVRRISHRVLVMYLGRVCELASSAALFRRPRHPYTRALIDSLPVADPAREPPEPAALGEISSLSAAPPGCPFHPRCAFARRRCREEVPEPEAIDDGTVACHRARELDLGDAG